MPPAYAGARKLSDREIDLIRRWIEKARSGSGTGRSSRPTAAAARGARRRIGRAIRSIPSCWPPGTRRAAAPSPEADRATLIRRVTLDLTGLPPTPAEVDAFLADPSPDAYEKVVDRLLASPRYGERMAFRWLDVARYADTNGYQTDGGREMWRWRDWVIDAFNRNMPFDQFTIEQIAGDLLPNADARSEDRHRLQSQPSQQRRRRHHPRGVPRRIRRRSRRDHGHRLARPDGGLRPLPRSQVRSDPQKDFYRLFAYLQQRSRKRAGLSTTATTSRTSRRRRRSSGGAGGVGRQVRRCRSGSTTA